MTPIQEYHNWYKFIEENPEDWEQRLIFADWLEDHANYEIESVDFLTLAEGQRWMVRNQKTPGGKTTKYIWWSDVDGEGRQLMKTSLSWHLKIFIFEHLQSFTDQAKTWRRYSSQHLHLAEIDLAQALKKAGEV